MESDKGKKSKLIKFLVNLLNHDYNGTLINGSERFLPDFLTFCCLRSRNKFAGGSFFKFSLKMNLLIVTTLGVNQPSVTAKTGFDGSGKFSQRASFLVLCHLLFQWETNIW